MKSENILRESGEPRAFAYFSLKTQFENIGDALINRELVRFAAAEIPVFVDISRCPDSFASSLGLNELKNVTILKRFGTVKLFTKILFNRLCGVTTYYFLSPGGYFGEKQGKELISAWLNTAILACLWMIGVKICHFGVSYERLGPRHLKVILARSALLCRHFVRDSNSSTYATEIGIRVDGTMPDLAIGVAEGRSCSHYERNAIAISFRVDQWPGQLKVVKNLISNFCKSLEVDIKIKFVAQVTRDVVPMQEMAQIVSSEILNHVEFVICNDDIEKCIETYSDCRYIVSNRLHALLIASIAGCTPIAVTDKKYNHKINGFFFDLGLAGNIFETESEDPGKAISSAIEHGCLVLPNFEQEVVALRSAFRQTLCSAVL